MERIYIRVEDSGGMWDMATLLFGKCPSKKSSMKVMAQETYMDQSKENSEMLISLSVKNVYQM